MSSDRSSRDALLIVVTAFAARLAFWFLFRDQAPRGDEVWYWDRAEELLRGNLGLLERGPGQVAFLAFCRALGCGLAEARLVGAILGCLVPLCVWDLGRMSGSMRAARAGGLIAALAPPLVGYSQFLWSEGLATSLLWLGLWSTRRAFEGRPTRWLVAAGILLGGATLTRVQWGLALPAVALWWTFSGERSERAGRARGAALLVAVGAAVVLPWAVRNQARAGTWVGLASQRWLPVAAGVLYPTSGEWFLGPSETGRYRSAAPRDWEERERYWRSVAVRAARDRCPEILWRKPIRNLSRLWGLHGQAARWVEKGWWKGDARLARTLVIYDVGGSAVMLLLGIPALVSRGRPEDVPVWFVLVAIHVVHLAANATPRFFVPMWPALALLTGRFLEPSSTTPFRRRLAAILVLGWGLSTWFRWGVDVAPAWVGP